MTDSIAADKPDPAPWPAPRTPEPAPEPAPAHEPTGTAAIVVGVIGSVVGAITFGVVWLAGNITLNSCRYAGPDGDVDVGRARVWLSLAALFWVAMPLTAGVLAKRASRNDQLWYVIAITYAIVGAWAVVKLGPWELCM